MTANAVRPGALTEQAVRDLVRDWYEALDRHVDLAQVLPYLIGEGLEMRFPEATLHTTAEFEGWYQAVTHRFFDEVHELKKVEVDLSEGDEATVDIVVNWQATVWNPPAPRSEWLGFDARQTWVV